MTANANRSPRTRLASVARVSAATESDESLLLVDDFNVDDRGRLSRAADTCNCYESAADSRPQIVGPQGKPDVGCTQRLMKLVALLVYFCARGCGCPAGIRFSLRPLYSECAKDWTKPRAHRAAGRVASEFPARLSHQSGDNPLPPDGVAPSVEIALHCRIWRELAGQGSPLAARRQNKQDRFDNLTQIDFPRSAQSAPRRQLSRDQLPLRIGHVACVAQPIALILLERDFGPRHVVPPSSRRKHEGITTDRNHSLLFRSDSQEPYEAWRLEGCGPRFRGLMVRDGSLGDPPHHEV
jgi:hypothetical protein